MHELQFHENLVNGVLSCPELVKEVYTVLIKALPDKLDLGDDILTYVKIEMFLLEGYQVLQTQEQANILLNEVVEEFTNDCREHWQLRFGFSNFLQLSPQVERQDNFPCQSSL